MDYAQFDDWQVSDILDYLTILGIWKGPAKGTDKKARRNAKNSLSKRIKNYKQAGMTKTQAILDYIAIKEHDMFITFDQECDVIYMDKLAHLPDVQSEACKPACVPVPVSTQIQGLKSGKKKAMRYDFDGDPILDAETSKRDYLESRARDTFYALDRKLEKSFGLVDDPAPTSPTELVERIKTGKFVLPENEKKLHFYGARDAVQHIRWRDPATKEDREGYKAANELLSKEFQKVADAANILDPKDALLAVQALENWTPTGLPN